MKNIFFAFLLAMLSIGANAQFSKATLQASGLTCSMCSKAVKEALEKVSFVEKVMVNIKTQEYSLTFKEGAAIDFDALSFAVEDAGFSIAKLKVATELNNVKAAKDQHVQIGGNYFHFLNGDGQVLNGSASFILVDKSFVTEKDFKKYSSQTKMECVKTGKAESCCKQSDAPADARVYHVII
jgi:copper chaperone CopZ